MKTYLHTKTCTEKFTAALFIIDPNWKQPSCLERAYGQANCGPSTLGTEQDRRTDSKIHPGDSPETSEPGKRIPRAFLRPEQDRHGEQVEVAEWA